VQVGHERLPAHPLDTALLDLFVEPRRMCGYLAFINVAVGIFNMLPGYPLDGGRVLRSALWARSRNVVKATRWAATSGTFISFGLIALGVASILFGGFVQGVWFIVIGWFLRNTSEQAYQQVLLKNTLQGARVGEMLNRSFVSAPPARIQVGRDRNNRGEAGIGWIEVGVGVCTDIFGVSHLDGHNGTV